RILVTVPVEEDEDVRVTGRQCAGQAGGAVATGRLPDNPGAGGGGDLRGAVGAAVVHDDDLVDEVARHLTDDAADRRLLVQRRDHHANPQVASACARVCLHDEGLGCHNRVTSSACPHPMSEGPSTRLTAAKYQHS